MSARSPKEVCGREEKWVEGEERKQDENERLYTREARSVIVVDGYDVEAEEAANLAILGVFAGKACQTGGNDGLAQFGRGLQG